MPKNTGRGSRHCAMSRSFLVARQLGGLLGKRPTRRQMRAAINAAAVAREEGPTYAHDF